MTMQYISQPGQPRHGRKQVTTSVQPITQVSTAKTDTTFTVSTVVAATAWDLSGVTANTGHVVTTSGGWRGEISGVDDANDTLTVRAWVRGKPGDRRAATVPADGETATIHVVDHCQQLLIDAIEANTAAVDVGFSSSVTSGAGHPISATAANPNSRLVLPVTPDPRRPLDVTQVYVIAGSTQNVSWIAMGGR